MSDEVPVEPVVEAPYTVRTSVTGDRVYLIKDGTRAWVKNPPTLEKLGFRLGEEKNISYSELMVFKDVGSIDMSGDVVVETRPDSPKTEEQKVVDDKVDAILGIK